MVDGTEDGPEGRPTWDREPAFEPGEGSPGRFSRRAFMEGASVLGGAAAYDAAFAHARAITGVTGLTGVNPGLLGELQSLLTDSKPSLTLALRRREDFLFIRIDGYNLRRSGQKLRHVLTSRDAYLVYTFEPQHIAEEAFAEPGGTPKAPGNAKARLAFPSRIAFVVPNGHVVPLTVAGLLDWKALLPSLVATAGYNPHFIEPDNARPGSGNGSSPVKIKLPPAPKLARPSNVETAIELPWRLLISPTSGGVWSHPRQVKKLRGWTELWHTRLAAGWAETAPDGGAFRAVWNYDTRASGKPTLRYKTPPAANSQPFLTSLNAYDRWEIVTATSNFYVSGRADAQANKLWLSARGGFLDSVGDWDSTAFALAEWKHVATLARDQYVKVVYKGFLFPFGHRAVYVKVTEREFEKYGGEIVANSRQIQYVVIREPTKSYVPGDTFGVANNSRDLPSGR